MREEAGRWLTGRARRSDHRIRHQLLRRHAHEQYVQPGSDITDRSLLGLLEMGAGSGLVLTMVQPKSSGMTRATPTSRTARTMLRNTRGLEEICEKAE